MLLGLLIAVTVLHLFKKGYNSVVSRHMNSVASFIESIRQEPENDELLLKYADWLVTRGDPLGLLIRVQRLLETEDLSKHKRAELKSQEQELLTQHETEWLDSLEGMINSYVFWRGLLGVVVSVSQFLTYADTLFSLKQIRFVDIFDYSALVYEEQMDILANSSFLRQVTYLELEGRYCYDENHELLHDKEVQKLVASPFIKNIIRLNLRCNAITDTGVLSIVQSPYLQRLEYLDLRCNLFGDDGLAALAAHCSLYQLRFLDLSYCDGSPTSFGWRTLAQSRKLQSLESLGLMGNRIAEDDMRLLRATYGNAIKV